MILNNYPLKYLYDMVEPCPAISHYYSLRNNHLFTVKVGLRNTLPNSVKSATSIAKFRQGLQKNNLVDKTKSKSYNH